MRWEVPAGWRYESYDGLRYWRTTRELLLKRFWPVTGVDRSYVGDMCTKLCRNYTLDIWVRCPLDSGGVDGQGVDFLACASVWMRTSLTLPGSLLVDAFGSAPGSLRWYLASLEERGR